MKDKNLKLFIAKIKKKRVKTNGIYLFGSRARGTARPDSDYDVLLVLPEKKPAIKDKLYDAAVDVLLKTGADLSLKIFDQRNFDKMVSWSSPFIRNVLEEGIKIG